MMLPPNYGPEYKSEFDSMYKKLAEKHQVPMIPFLLEGVAGKEGLNQSDGIHPNQKGHVKMGETVYKHLKKYL